MRRERAACPVSANTAQRQQETAQESEHILSGSHVEASNVTSLRISCESSHTSVSEKVNGLSEKWPCTHKCETKMSRILKLKTTRS